jgi:hypothetical protein
MALASDVVDLPPSRCNSRAQRISWPITKRVALYSRWKLFFKRVAVAVGMGNHPDFFRVDAAVHFDSTKPQEPTTDGNGERVQHQCFSSAVVADEQCKAWVEGEYPVIETVEIRDGQSAFTFLNLGFRS